MAENYTIETDIIYEGNGAVKEFPITFSFSNENEVVVYLNGELIRKGYSIDGDSVVFNIAPAEGDEIALAKAIVDTPEEEENTSGESSESGSNTVYDQASREHIKINPVPTKVKYSGNGEVTEFPTGFAFFENDNIVVYLNGVIIDGGYSVTGVGETDGGSVIFEEAPKEGDKIVILRKVAIERVTDFQEGGAFRAKNINDELDRQTAFCQQVQEQIDRCVKVEVTDDQDPQELIDKVFDQLDLATEVGEQAIKTAQETQELVEGSKALIQEETQKAIEQLSLSSDEIINKARIWAEGEQEEVKPLGGELSSMGAADLAYAIANAPEDTPIDASGLFAMNVVKGEKGDKGDKGDDGKDGVDGKSVFDGYATNCITEIPQDIKLELNNGTLILKAGSKVYVPNGKNTDGSNKFDVVAIESDINVIEKYDNSNVFLIYSPSRQAINVGLSCASGTTTPTATSSYILFYNTTDNKCYYDRGFWEEVSLPIAIVDRSSAIGFSSINQVFNGFGYIGSTVYALPGVKGLTPNGRNADGSLRNKEFVTNGVNIETRLDYGTNIRVVKLGSDYISGMAKNNYTYDEVNNYNYESNNLRNCVVLGKLVTNNNVITSFTMPPTFHAVDYNNTNVDFVVKTYKNGANWYRIYKSGWIEQGGITGGIAQSGGSTINLLKPFADTSYHIQGNTINGKVYTTYGFAILSKTTTTFDCDWANANAGDGTYWFACGYGA